MTRYPFSEEPLTNINAGQHTCRQEKYQLIFLIHNSYNKLKELYIKYRRLHQNQQFDWSLLSLRPDAKTMNCPMSKHMQSKTINNNSPKTVIVFNGFPGPHTALASVKCMHANKMSLSEQIPHCRSLLPEMWIWWKCSPSFSQKYSTSKGLTENKSDMSRKVVRTFNR